MKNIFGSFIVCTFLFAPFSWSQKVGIGTTSPAGKLHVKGSANTSQLIIDAHSTQNNTAPLFKLRNSLGTDLLWLHSDDTSNIFIGLRAGKFNNAGAAGLYNTFIGSDAGSTNTTGAFNTANGNHALYANTTGAYNTANGFAALFSNTIGANNTANGFFSLGTNTSGNNNTTNGYQALYSNTTGSNNIANGFESLYSNTTGSNNSAYGSGTLWSNTTGNNITAIGHGASAADEISNATAIGSHAYSGASNSVVIGSIDGINGATASANVGIGTTTPNPSSVLDVSSTTKGLLPPRMTVSERNLIVSPPEGLMIWCNNCGVYGQIQVYNGTIWTNMVGVAAAGIPAVGDSDGGGKVAYILQSGDPGYVAGEIHGIIAALSDQSGQPEWGCVGTNISGADGTALGTGNQNTIDIVNGCSTGGIAARICNDLVLGGYSDWYLPGKDELNKLYLNKAAIGGFVFDHYWSSSEIDIDFVWTQEFNSGNHFNGPKNNTNIVRAIRAF